MNDDQFDSGPTVVTCGYDARPSDAMEVGYERQFGDIEMNETFDFQGYYGEQRAGTTTVPRQQGKTDPYRPFDDSQDDQDMDIDPMEEADDEHCSRSLSHTALANYYSSNLLQSSLIPPNVCSLEDDLVDPPGSIDIVRLATFACVEKWDVGKDTMEYLGSVLALSAPVDDFITLCGLQPQIRHIKLEEPILSSDPATDMQRLRERNVVRLTSHGIKPYHLDRRNDEGLRWSARSLKLPEDMDKLIAAEKMTINSETGGFLKQIFDDMNGDALTSITQDRRYKVNIAAHGAFVCIRLTRTGSSSTCNTPITPALSTLQPR